MSFVGSEQTETTRDDAAQAVPRGALVVREPREPRELPAVLSLTPTVPGLLQAARRRWKLALFLGLLLGGAAAAGMWFAQPEKYIARSMVLVSESSILQQPGQQRGDHRTQIATVKSRMVLNAALRDPQVARLDVVSKEIEPITWLEKEIVADFSVASDIMRIQMTGGNPHEMLALVTAVRKQYLSEIRQREMDVSQTRVNKLTEIYTDLDGKLQEKKRMLKRMAEEMAGNKDAKMLEARREFYFRMLDNLQNEVIKAQSKLREAQMELAVEQAGDPKSTEVPLLAGAIEEAVQNHPDIKRFRQNIANDEYKTERLKKSFLNPEKEDDYKNAVAALAAGRKELAALETKVREEANKGVREGVQRSDAAKKQQVLHLEKQAKWLDDLFNERVKAFQEAGKKQVDVEWLQAEIKLEDDLAQKVGLQRQLLQVEMHAPSRYREFDEPFVVPDTDTRVKKAGMAGGGVFALVVFGIAFLEFRSRRVSSVDEIVRGLRMRLVGALPNLPARARNYGGSKRPADVKWQHQMAESVESARTMLLYAAENESLRVIAITSAVGGEGKTLTCSHLAASLARAGRKTLLIDADLRRPSLQRLFNLNPHVGLSELLRGDAQPGAAVQETPIPGLSVISAGASDDRAIQALSQPVLGELIKQLRGQYDFVIVDTAPVLPVADSQVICQHADGVIFAILRDVSRLPQIYSAHERLVSLKIRILGAIVNGTDGPVYGSSYVYSRTNHANADKA